MLISADGTLVTTLPIKGTAPSITGRKAPDGMRILQLGKYYHPYMGGIETHLHELCTRLARTNHVEAVVCNTQRQTVRETVSGVDVTRVGSLGRVSSTELCPWLPLELSSRSYDILHLHSPNPMGMLAYFT